MKVWAEEDVMSSPELPSLMVSYTEPPPCSTRDLRPCSWRAHSFCPAFLVSCPWLCWDFPDSWFDSVAQWVSTGTMAPPRWGEDTVPLGSCCCWGDPELGKQTAPCERSRMLIGGNMLTVIVIFQSLAWRGAVCTWLFSSNFSVHPWAEKFRALDVISSLPAFYFLLWGGELGRKW